MIGWGLPYYFERFAYQQEFLKEINQLIALSETTEAETLPAESPPIFESLEFKNVSFSYPGTEKKVLENISFTINKGKSYAFVGINGAGKTTLAKLATRLYDDYDGEILLNKQSLRNWPIAMIKACFCVLFQDFARYDITVAENVAIGWINGYSKPLNLEKKIDEAIVLSGFDKTTTKLRNGKNTLLGKTNESGVELSSGQWQSLAFARAIINPAPVKILDEPTAALDPMAENQVYNQFKSISRGLTTIYISHRLASAKLADVIFVINGGKVAEQGCHEELMAAQGLYAEMFESQQSWYL